jgi:N-acylglucosamine-6-phosphate 2-epimerase
MRNASIENTLNAIRGGLVVSCQPVDGGPFDHHESVLNYAKAAVLGGAKALRIEGAERLAYVRAHVSLPIVGIVKRDLVDSPVRITPLIEDVRTLVKAGADIVAVDATARERPVTIAALLAEIRSGRSVAMADCSSESDALAAHALGFDLIGTTLAGYTGASEEIPVDPDFELIRSLAPMKMRLMAEGRFNTPSQAALAISLGAWAVTVGTAITRPEVVTDWFAQSIAAASAATSEAQQTPARLVKLSGMRDPV